MAAAEFLLKHPQSTGKLGAVGFCFGGGMVNRLAVRIPQLAAGVPFYGSAPPLEDVPKIKAALLLQFAEEDPRINARWPDYEAALKASGVKYEAYVYPKTHHGFHNDTTPRYDAEAAKLVAADHRPLQQDVEVLEKFRSSAEEPGVDPAATASWSPPVSSRD